MIGSEWAEKARLHRQRVENIARRQQLQQRRVAVQRHGIPGADHLHTALTQIEMVQQKLAKAGETLRTLLSIAPLAQAYSQFQNEGGVTANHWTLWLDGETLGRTHHASKSHLRIVATCHAPSKPQEMIEAEADGRTECDSDGA